MQIREYQTQDEEQIITIFNECFNKEIAKHNIVLNDNKKIIVACDNDIVMGLLELDILMDSLKNKKYMLVSNVCVKKDCANQGIATLLMNKVDEIAINNNCSYITLTSNKTRIYAHKLYKKCGYQIYDTCVFKKYFD